MPEMNPTEEWRPVKGWEDFYSVSSLGRVMRTKETRFAVSGKFLSTKPMADGYVRVLLYGYGGKKKRKFILVHLMVLDAFIGRMHGMDCNHKNGNKSDNRLLNLEWCTRSENVLHAYRVLGRKSPTGDAHGRAKLNSSQVETIRKLLAENNSQKKIAAIFGVAQTTISAIKRGIIRPMLRQAAA